MKEYLTTNKPNYYLGIYVDILGQGEKLARMNKMPVNEEEDKVFTSILHETLGSVIKVQTLFDDFFESFQKVSDDTENLLKSLSKENQKIFLEARKTNVKDIRFSDTIIIYFSLDKESCINPMGSVFAALAAAGATFAMSLSSKIPLRGAINIGTGTEIKKSGLYGQLLHSLHHIESKVADYPRIIIGEELIEMIQAYDNDPNIENDILRNIDKAFIPRIKQMIKIDHDGHAILHYLQEEFAGLPGVRTYDMYGKIKKYIDSELIKYQDNKILTHRYKKLKKYVRSNQFAWKIDNTNIV